MMQEIPKTVVTFQEVGKDDVASVGGKGANLGEMTQAKIPVPPGFIVTAQAYFNFLDANNLINKIRALLEPVNVHDSKQLQDVAAQVRQIIIDAPMPKDISDAIMKSYTEMGDGFVAVRSSATAEDLPEASFAGQQSTYLNIEGKNEVVTAVQQCWASLFEARAIFYRVEQGFDHFQVGIAVPVQRMVQSEASGVMFTLEPVSSDTSKITVEAVLGLGEMIVSGDVTPDTYLIDKETVTILNKTIAPQEWKLVKNQVRGTGEANVKIELTPEEKAAPKITDEEILKVAALGKQLEALYQFPQDVEWAKEGGNIYIVQTRPVTTIKESGGASRKTIDAPVLVSGAPASPGIAFGSVKVVPDPSFLDKVQAGDVLVAEMTTPDFVPAMKRAAAIVTDRGGRTAHAAIVSRELGIPCVVGTGDASITLKDGQIITVDGSTGNVYNGKIEIEEEEDTTAKDIKTRTRIYVNLAQPDLAERVAKRNVDGVGLLRAEFMIAQIGEHPLYMINQGRGQEFVDKLAKSLLLFTRAFNPRPVVYRTNDFKTNEYRDLKGGEQYEEIEENPMIGFRGVSRYTQQPEVFRLELQAIKKVREQYQNLNIMLPFVRTVSGLQGIMNIIHDEGLYSSDDFKIWMMVEVPSNIILLEKFIDVGIDGISIGSNDLTQLTLGVDRDNEKLAKVFNELDEAVMASLERAVTVARQKGITASICGQAPSFYPQLTTKLVEWGITSVSVSPDMIDKTRLIVSDAEKQLGITV